MAKSNRTITASSRVARMLLAAFMVAVAAGESGCSMDDELDIADGTQGLGQLQAAEDDIAAITLNYECISRDRMIQPLKGSCSGLWSCFLELRELAGKLGPGNYRCTGYVSALELATDCDSALYLSPSTSDGDIEGWVEPCIAEAEAEIAYLQKSSL